MTLKRSTSIELSNIQNNLEWDYVKDINAIIAGKRGGGKSYLAMSAAFRMAGSRVQLFIIDYKRSDFSRLKKLDKLPDNRVASSKEEIFALLEYYIELMNKRIDYFNSLDDTFGKTAKDIGMLPFYLIYDEFGAFNSTLDAKEKKRHDALIKQITLMGRQYSFGIMIILQQASVGNSGLDTSIKEQCGLIVQMGNATPSALRQTFREDIESQDMKFEIGQGQLWMESFSNSNKTYPFTAFYVYKDLLWKQFEINVYDQNVDTALTAHN